MGFVFRPTLIYPIFSIAPEQVIIKVSPRYLWIAKTRS